MGPCGIHLWAISQSVLKIHKMSLKNVHLKLQHAIWYCRTLPSSVQVMACHLCVGKPLPKPLMTCCKSDTQEQTSVNSLSKYKRCHSGKCIWKFHQQNGSHFDQASVYHLVLVLVYIHVTELSHWTQMSYNLVTRLHKRAIGCLLWWCMI